MVPRWILFLMACSLTPSLAAASTTVTLSILSYTPTYTPSASTLACQCLRTLCHSVRGHVYGQFGDTQHLGDDPEPCRHADQRHQGETKPQLQVLLKRLVNLASGISRLK